MRYFFQFPVEPGASDPDPVTAPATVPNARVRVLSTGHVKLPHSDVPPNGLAFFFAGAPSGDQVTIEVWSLDMDTAPELLQLAHPVFEPKAAHRWGELVAGFNLDANSVHVVSGFPCDGPLYFRVTGTLGIASAVKIKASAVVV